MRTYSLIMAWGVVSCLVVHLRNSLHPRTVKLFKIRTFFIICYFLEIEMYIFLEFIIIQVSYIWQAQGRGMYKLITLEVAT